MYTFANATITRLTTDPAEDQYPEFQPIPNTAPTVVNDSLTMPYNTGKSINVLGNDVDEEPLNPANLIITAQPFNGTAEVVQGQIQYTPEDGFTGEEQLTYQICDSFLLDQKCATGVLSITVQDPGAPVLTVSKIADSFYSADTHTYSASTLRPTFSGAASPGSAIKIEIHSDPILLTTTANEAGEWSITPTADLPAGDHTVYISAAKDGVTTELESFVLSVTNGAEIPNTGGSTLPLRFGGMALLAAGVGLHSAARRRTRQRTPLVPSLFP